ncbi:MAG: type VI secretion system membrane subunit TssM [Casimicrobiaceae bacterium]
MRRFFSLIFNRTLLVLLGLVALALIIWFVGPIVAIGSWQPLESELVRLIIIGLIFAIWIAVRLFRWWRDHRANASLLSQIAKDDGGTPPATQLGVEEIAELRRRFDAAMATLKKTRIESGEKGLFARMRRRYVYQMPWYMIIGAPGSGKTTALVNSGIEFPLAKEFGKAAIRGVGGTRNCDWWFTNDAVLLDTAGRYTTQESNEALDRTEWTGFLTLLRKFRPRAPINGILLTISVPDLLGTTEAEREHHAAAIRRRLAEVEETLKMRFPVYVLVTKVDLLSGFNEYFSRMTAQDRAQVWGFTLRLADSEAINSDVATLFRNEFALLQKRVEDALPEVLLAEMDVQKRALIYAFSQELAGLREVLNRFVEVLFAPSKFAAPPFVRGVYLTSGTQEGTPFDRVLGAIQRKFGVSAPVQSLSAAQGSGRSYFLRDLLQRVVFVEAHLVARNPARERRRRIIQAVGVTTCLLLLVGASIAWFTSFANNRGYLAEIAPRAVALGETVKTTPNTTVDDFASLLPILDEARNLARSDRFDIDAPPVTYRFGLYQGYKVGAAAEAAYEGLLEDLLLPRVALRVRRLLGEAPAGNLETLYGRLKGYLMLYEPDHYRANFLLAAVTADWQAKEGNNLPIEVQRSLALHLQRLFDDRVRQSPFPIDESLVAEARTRLGQYTQAQRLYLQIKGIVGEQVRGKIPDFTLVAAVGPDAKIVFARASGVSLDQGIPALFTRDGYRAFSNTLQDRRLLLTLDESWVLGAGERSASARLSSLIDDRLVTDVRRLYLEDYRVTWDRFLTDLRLASAPGLSASITLARTLSSPDSPLIRLIKAVATETTLAETGKQGIAVTDRAVAVAKEAGSSAIQRVFGSKAGRLDGPVEADRAGRIEKQIVDDYFEAWRRLAGSPQQGGSSEQLKQMVSDLYSTLVAIEFSLRAGNAPPQTDVPGKMRAEAARLPVPLRGMMDGLAAASANQVGGVARSNIGAQLDSTVGDFCRKAIAGRYPFVRSSPRDVTPDDFARIFAPGGLMDDFFQKNLQAYVDTSTSPWSFKKGLDGIPGGTTASILAFQRAAVIRDVFFRGGARAMQFRVDAKPIEMDPTITTFSLDADGTQLSYLHGPQTPRSIVWPGPAGRNQVRVQLTPQLSSGSGVTYEGPWALHRLFDRAQIVPGSTPERFTATLNLDGRRIVLEVTAASVLNPFRLRELDEFACPGRL